MASNRHLGRIIALQSLYEWEFRTKAGDNSVDMDSIVAKNIEPYAKALGDVEFVHDLANGVLDEIKSFSLWRLNGQSQASRLSTETC